MFSDRQNEIITTAINIIAKNGIQNLTIKNLSKEIGISEAAIYRHFKSKTDILLNMLDQFKQFKINNLQEILEININSFSKIETLFNKLLTKFSETPALVSIVFSDDIFKNDKGLSEKILDIISTNELMLKKIILEAQKKKEIRNDIDCKFLIMIILGSLRLLVKKWEMNNYNYNLVEEGKNLANSLKILLQINN